MNHDGKWDRRSVLRTMTAVAGGAFVSAPLLSKSALARTDPGADADALFKAGKFEQAGRAYETLLNADPGNVHAARQRGYVALLANQFPDAETYLKLAIRLSPDDPETNTFLAECYTRQDKFSLAAPCWQAAGDEINAEWFAAIRGAPYEIHGDIGRLPWQQLDPTPLVEVSLNGGQPKRFAFYTRVASVGMSATDAAEAGVRAVAEQTLDYIDPPLRMYFGVLESMKLGGIEVRNIPVSWTDDADGPVQTGGSGMIGTWLFYHFLTTIDYAGRSLILRRRTAETISQIRADAERAGAEPLPLWLAREQMLYSTGSIADSGPGVVRMHIGGFGEDVAGMSVETARRLRIRTDYDRPLESLAGLVPVIVYPCYPSEVRLGNAVAKDSYCLAVKDGHSDGEGFDVLGSLNHGFYKPYNVTLDFTDMNVFIAPGKAK